MVFVTELLNMIGIVWAAKFTNYFFRNVPTNILTVIRFIFFLLFSDFTEKFKIRNWRLVIYRRRNIDYEWP